MKEVSLHKYIPANREGKKGYHCFSILNKLMSLDITHQRKERQPHVSYLPFNGKTHDQRQSSLAIIKKIA